MAQGALERLYYSRLLLVASNKNTSQNRLSKYICVCIYNTQAHVCELHSVKVVSVSVGTSLGVSIENSWQTHIRTMKTIYLQKGFITVWK